MNATSNLYACNKLISNSEVAYRLYKMNLFIHIRFQSNSNCLDCTRIVIVKGLHITLSWFSGQLKIRAYTQVPRKGCEFWNELLSFTRETRADLQSFSKRIGCSNATNKNYTIDNIKNRLRSNICIKISLKTALLMLFSFLQRRCHPLTRRTEKIVDQPLL